MGACAVLFLFLKCLLLYLRGIICSLCYVKGELSSLKIVVMDALVKMTSKKQLMASLALALSDKVGRCVCLPGISLCCLDCAVLVHLF